MSYSSLSYSWAIIASSNNLTILRHNGWLLDFNFHVFVDFWHSSRFDRGLAVLILIFSLGSCIDLELGKVGEDFAHCCAGEHKVLDQSALEQLGANAERA